MDGDLSFSGRTDFGWRPDPAGVDRFLASLPHAPTLAQAAPYLMGDGQTGDVLPYMAWYEVELLNDDGTVWKAKGDEPPYIAQTGNNCTSEGLARAIDLLQVMHIARQQRARIATGEDPDSLAWTFHRTAIEATYAFGLSKANMRGDEGCFGGAMAQGAREIGTLTYKHIGTPYEESHSRLVKFANNPAAVIKQYGSLAAPYQIGSVAQVKTPAEVRAALANNMLVTVASSTGYENPRDKNGICRRRGQWNHQMHYSGSITSDGTPTLVCNQSWGPNQPTGPQPFNLPSFSFRVTDADAQTQLDAGDSYAIGLFPGFETAPLPDDWSAAFPI